MNSVKMNGKESRAPCPALVSTILATEFVSHPVTDATAGTSAACVCDTISAVISTTAMSSTSAEL